MADLNQTHSRGKRITYSKSAHPPRVPEDDLIGIWEGPGGTLYLNEDLSYLWRAPDAHPTAPVSIASQRGEFSYRNKQLRMVPLARRQDPAIVSVVLDASNRITVIRSGLGDMRLRPREVPQEKPARSIPSAVPSPDEVTDNSSQSPE